MGNKFHDVAMRAKGTLTYEKLASKLGLSPAQTYDRFSGEVSFKLEEARELFKVLPDARLVAWMLQGTRFTVAEKFDHQADTSHILDQSITAVARMAQILVEVQRALTDKHLDHNDRRRIRDAVDATAIKLATIRILVDEHQTRD